MPHVCESHSRRGHSLVAITSDQAEPPLMFFEEPDEPRRRKKGATHGKRRERVLPLQLLVPSKRS
jgi:hypothetical protein